MNKNELITFLRNPNDLKESDLAELEQIIEISPYFLSGRMLLAKGSKEIKHPDTRKRISSAAVYSTDRPLLKKYISGKLFFLSKPPEKEEILEQPLQETALKKSEPEKEPNKSQKIEIITTPKTSKPEKENLEAEEKPEEPTQKVSTTKNDDSVEGKPRREPRFDPSATASFKRRWDVKDVSEAASKNTGGEEKSTSKPIFVGKKVDRSKRVRKKSMRDELLNETSPKNKKPEPTNPKPDKKVKEEITIQPTKSVEKTQTDAPKSSPEVVKVNPQVSSGPSPATKPEESKIENISPFQKKTDTTQEKPKATRPRSPETVKSKEVEKPHTPVIIKASTKPTLEIPDVPSEGIDAILEELQRDMESLKSSRSRFVEVQQKIEEDDAVSAALERATSKISNLSPKPEPKASETEVKKIEDLPSSEEAKPADIPPKSEEKKTPKKSIEKENPEEAKGKAKAKKPTSSKKKPIAKKESTSKKTSPKKVSEKKATAKAKSSKTKATKKDEKKDDDKSGKQKIDQNTIIDKFIAETPSIKYQKKSEPVLNKDLSDISTEWNKELASEYLAEIYLHQGNKKRAIEIYTALSLKFPEKKSYFADLISKTK